MEKISQTMSGAGRKKIVKTPALLSPDKTLQSDDIERVLEHVSSGYRWELLESLHPKNPGSE